MLRSLNGNGRSIRQTSGASCSMSGKVRPRDQIEKAEGAGAQQAVVRVEDLSRSDAGPLRRQQSRRQVGIDERKPTKVVRQGETRDERLRIGEDALALERDITLVERFVVMDERIVSLRDFLEIPALADEISLFSRTHELRREHARVGMDAAAPEKRDRLFSDITRAHIRAAAHRAEAEPRELFANAIALGSLRLRDRVCKHAPRAIPRAASRLIDTLGALLDEAAP